MSTKKTFSRRQILGATGGVALSRNIFTNPITVILHQIILSLAARRNANAQGIELPRNYVLCYVPGGVSSWHLFQPITPFEAANPAVLQNGQYVGGNYIPNTSMVNHFNSSGVPEYQSTPITIQGKTYHLPILWASTIPRPNSLFAPMSSLAQNMLLIRGVVGVDGHTSRSIDQPNQNERSLLGIVADGAPTLFPSISTVNNNQYNTFRSNRSGQQFINLAAAPTPLHEVHRPFDPADLVASDIGQKLRNSSILSEAFAETLTNLENEEMRRNPGVEALLRDFGGAEQLLSVSLTDLTVRYNTLLAKYRDLMERSKALDPAIIGPVPQGIAGTIVAANGANLGSQFPGLPEMFAFAEYLSTFNFGDGNIGLCGALKITPQTNIANLTGLGTAPATNTLDEHNSDPARNILVHAFWQRTLASCMYEYIDRLKAVGKFNDTVIQWASEFTRSPRPGANPGNDHGFQSMVGVYWSGDLPVAPIVVGNFARTSTDNAHPGTWMGAPVRDINNQMYTLTPQHLGSTLAHLCRVESPNRNTPSVVQRVSAGNYLPTIEPPKNS